MKHFALIGILLGLIIGLIPGLHSNTIISFLYSLGIPSEIFPIFIITLFGAYSVSSFIPSIFFGIPDDSSILTVLPGQKLVKEGKGFLALKTVLFSVLFASLISVALFPFSLSIFPFLYSLIKPHMFYILILLSSILILKTKNPIYSLIIFLISGLLGYSTFSLKLEDPFLPLFTGMFAIAAMFAYKKTKLPPQKDSPLDLSIFKYIVLGVIGGFLADLIPGVSSPSQVAAFISLFLPITSLGYLATISSVSISEAIFALSTTASINKSRIGAIVWLNDFSDVAINPLPYLTLFLFSVLITCFILYKLRSKISILTSIDFSKFNLYLIFYLSILVYFIDGIMGLVVFFAATLLGYITLILKVERTMLMGTIILPTILFLLNLLFH